MREHTIARIRMLRAVGLSRPRRRVPRQQQPDAIRLEYFKAIRARVLDPVEAIVRRVVFPVIPGVLAARADAARLDAGGKKLRDAIDRAGREMTEQIRPRDLEDLADGFAKRTSGFQREQLRQQAHAAIGADVFMAEPDLGPLAADFTAENVSLITSIGPGRLRDVEQQVFNAARSGQRWEDLAEVIRDRYSVSESRAKLIARDQVGKFYGDLNRVRQQAMGVDSYIWRTVRDNRVRSEHEERDGQTFKWSQPPEDGHPGIPINCRCFAEPDFSSILADL